jgi:hypothetical protein
MYLRCGVTEQGFCLKWKGTYMSGSNSFLTTLVTIFYRNVCVIKNTQYIVHTKYSEMFIICKVKSNDLSIIRNSLQTQVFKIGKVIFSNFLI